MALKTVQGGCHCGAVRFEIDTEEPVELIDCNCSVCFKSGGLHLILPLSRFRLLQGEESLSTYTFNTGVAKHTFCKVCGIKSFYWPRSNPDGIDINARCLDEPLQTRSVVPFNGQNWEQHAHTLAHKSIEE